MSRPGSPSFRAGVLVGGASRRMGTPKQLLVLEGLTFAERVVAALAERASSVVLIGDGPAPAACDDLPRLADVPGVPGPLAGVLAALRSARDRSWVIAACDQPLLSATAIDWLLSQATEDAWAVMPEVGGGVQPFPGLYDPRCEEALARAASAGPAGPSVLAGDPRTLTPRPPAALAAAWRSVDTPEQAAELRARPG